MPVAVALIAAAMLGVAVMADREVEMVGVAVMVAVPLVFAPVRAAINLAPPIDRRDGQHRIIGRRIGRRGPGTAIARRRDHQDIFRRHLRNLPGQRGIRMSCRATRSAQ